MYGAWDERETFSGRWRQRISQEIKKRILHSYLMSILLCGMLDNGESKQHRCGSTGGYLDAETCEQRGNFKQNKNVKYAFA